VSSGLQWARTARLLYLWRRVRGMQSRERAEERTVFAAIERVEREVFKQIKN
jgi:hypothetical protein